MLISRYKNQSGFTLIELIIVIVIVAIIASLATISVSDNKQELLQTETKRFQALFVLAQQEAVLQSRHLGVRFSQGAYQFYQMLDPKQSPDAQAPREARNSQAPNANNTEEDLQPKWQPLHDNILKLRHLPKVLVSQLYLDGISVELLTLKAAEENRSNNINTNDSTNAQSNKPQIFLLSSGENTAFEYQLNYNGVGRANIKVDSVGKFTFEYVYDQQYDQQKE